MGMPRHSKNGFSMVQMLFVLLIVCVLALQARPYRPSLHVFMKQMLNESILMQEKAMKDKVDVVVKWEEKRVLFDGRVIEYPSSISCSSVSYHYNPKGNISKACSIVCTDGKVSRKLVFQLGFGRGRLE